MLKFNTINEDVWVFLSHSHNDYEKVMEVRNLLEKRNFRPLMFFLKCLEDDNEIDNLIKREIDCRYRFILCDSHNAQNSQWVQREVEYIKKIKNRYYETINIDNMTLSEIDEVFKRFEIALTMTLCFTEDRKTDCDKVIVNLQKYGFKIQTAIVDEEFIENTYIEDLKKPIERGYVVLLLDDSSFKKFSIKLASKPIEDMKRLIFLKSNEFDAFVKMISTLNHEEAMAMSHNMWGNALVELIDHASCSGGSPGLQLLLGRIYEYGEYGVNINLEKAFEYYQMARMDGIFAYEDMNRVNKKIEDRNLRIAKQKGSEKSIAPQANEIKCDKDKTHKLTYLQKLQKFLFD